MKENRQGSDKVLITTEEIRSILDNYRIGKKPLAKLLGWGETTIIRYMEGDTPTAEYSNKLREIEKDPAYYYTLLLKNKDSLTNVAFRKSKQAVLNKLMESKISLIAQYIVNRMEGDVSPMFVQAVLYYGQGFSLALYDRELFEEDYSVNAENIPYMNLHENIKKHGINIMEVSQNRLTKEEIALLDGVIDSFGWYGYRGIKEIIGEERNSYRISRDKNNNRIISKELIKKGFKDIVAQYDIKNGYETYKYIDKKIMELKEEK